VELNNIPAMQEEIKQIVDAVHHAYIHAINNPF
jgi:hypothetical protein